MSQVYQCQKKDGTKKKVPIEKLSEEDQQWLKDRAKGK